jgi:hypothetical protein
MKALAAFFASLFIICLLLSCKETVLNTDSVIKTFNADHPYILFSGRYVKESSGMVKTWQPGQFFKIKFKGKKCEIIIHDEVKWGNHHNYLHIVLNGNEKRIQLKTKRDTILVGKDLNDSEHELIVYKATEANIGFIELESILCDSILPQESLNGPRIEFIGNSITCGAGSDPSKVPCGQAQWHDQHNSYFSYPSILTRALGADSQLSCVSGIGLMRSCCNMEILMPTVYHAANMSETSPAWDFNQFTPDLISICLGQNDGVQDEESFVSNYKNFINQVHDIHPNAKIILLSSPMADDTLRTFQRKVLTRIALESGTEINQSIPYHIFEKSYVAGCDYHPNLNDHQQIAAELLPKIQSLLK